MERRYISGEMTQKVMPNQYLFHHSPIRRRSGVTSLEFFQASNVIDKKPMKILVQSHFIYWAIMTLKNVYEENHERYKIFEEKLLEHIQSLYGNPLQFTRFPRFSFPPQRNSISLPSCSKKLTWNVVYKIGMSWRLCL